MANILLTCLLLGLFLTIIHGAGPNCASKCSKATTCGWNCTGNVTMCTPNGGACNRGQTQGTCASACLAKSGTGPINNGLSPVLLMCGILTKVFLSF